MGNLPISAHITVVSAAPAALPDAASSQPGVVAPAASTDFPNLLAGQIAARKGPPVDSALAAERPTALQKEALPDQKAGADADVTEGLGVVGFIPFSPLPLQTGRAIEASSDAQSEARPGLGKLLAALPDARSDQSFKLDATATAAAEDGKLPANIAARPLVLPTGKDACEAVDAVLSKNGHGLKLVASPELTTGSTTETAPPPGLLAHGMVAAKSDVPAAQVSTPVVTVASQVGAPAWGAELGQKVVWLANQQQQVAQIHVTPPQLGPIEIHLKLASDQANAIFVSPHAAVRDAIESALPQLRELLAESGLSLGNVDVSSQSPGQFGQAPGQSANDGNNSSRRVAEFDPGAVPGASAAGMLGASRSGQGLVDLFA